MKYFRIYILTITLTTSLLSVFAQNSPQEIHSDSTVMNFLTEQNVNLTYKNRVHILKSGEEKFTDLFHVIRQARHHIHLEYFNFRNDSIASLLLNELALKAAEGVEVRAMFDAFGNWSNNKPLKKKHLKKVRESGVEIVKYDPLTFPYINHISCRDHRKIVVIDGQVAYTGGMNVADYYVDGLPDIGDWRDMHIRIEGEAVDDLQRIFLGMWNKATKQNIGGEAYFPVVKDSLSITDSDSITIAIVDRKPRKTPKIMREVYAKSILEAEEKIELINPYFVPTRKVRRALKKAIDKGIDVEIMISAQSDIPFTPDASFHVAHKLMKRGAKIYLFNEGFHHSKIMMIDDKFCTVGSTNLNSRSLRYDYEVNAFIFNEEVTGQLSDIFEQDKEHSTLMTEENWKKRSRWKRFVGWFANILTPFL